jgi:alkylation response protein AidB-like acyl-CoA dehydrogenase
MDFQLSEEMRLVRDAAREFAETCVAPGAAERDQNCEFPIEAFKAAAEQGFAGVTAPEEYGGADLGNLALILMLIEVNKACASTGVTLSVHASLCSEALIQFGTDDQKQRFLPRLTSGEWIGAYCLSEAVSGSDAAALVCPATEDDEHFVIEGTKLWVTSASHAGLFIVFARTSREAKNSRGITCFAVPADTPGLTVSRKEDKLGIRASSTCEVVFENCRVPKADVIGEVGEGFKIAMALLDGGRIGIGAQAVGIGRASLEASIKYAQEREQFGRPIAKFQAIQFKLAEMSAMLDASELLVLRAAWLKDQGLPHGKEAATAKLFASQSANHCAREAVQIHGGAGYLVDFPVERYMRDARITELYEGTTEIQKLVVARHLLR